MGYGTIDPPASAGHLAESQLAGVTGDVSRCRRRLEVLDVLATRSAQALSEVEAAAALVVALQESHDDVPFALVYLVEDGGAAVRLAAAVGIEPGHPAAAEVVELSEAPCVWPLRQAVNAPLETPLPAGPWPERAHAALVIPLRSGDGEDARCFGFLVAGEGPGAPPDAEYRTFLRLACTQFTTAAARAEVRTKLEGTAWAAETALRAKDDFLAMLGHELRNPLSPILTALQLIRMRGSESRELVVIERQVGHLVRLVDDLLDVSRVTSGKIALRKQRLELAVIVARGLEMVSPLLDQKKHRLELEVLFEGLVVHADADRLAQVISNLLTNAAKYSDAGTTIRVTTSRVGDRARVSVRDEGVGIPTHMLDAIFDRFVQEPQPLDRSKGGLRLGLTIVRSLVELHGGTVTVQSDGPGTGSEFSVELPLAQLDEQLEVAGTPGWSAKHGSKADPTRNRVLVVDDNRDAADCIAELLTAFGYEVAVAYDGPTALTVADTFKPHTCVLDIGLPVMDGYELARLLRQSEELLPGLRLIAITGYGQEADRHRSTEAGFDAHLVKPVQIDELAKIVMT